MRLALTTGRSCPLCCSSPLVLQWAEPHSPLVANLTCSLFPCGVRIAGRSSFRRITSCSSCDRVSNWEMRHRGEHTHPGRNRTVIRCEMLPGHSSHGMPRQAGAGHRTGVWHCYQRGRERGRGQARAKHYVTGRLCKHPAFWYTDESFQPFLSSELAVHHFCFENNEEITTSE